MAFKLFLYLDFKLNLLPSINRHYGRVVILTFTLLSYIHTSAQWKDSVAVKKSQIVVSARPQQDGKIMLRWAITTPRAWRRLNNYGYQLKRYTITRDGTTLTKPIDKDLGVFKPLTLKEWMPLIDDNDNAAIMAQSLYGEGFEVGGMDKLSAIVNLAEEQAQRFTWALYVADQDYETALLAGLGYVDRDIKFNEKYVYKVTSLVPETELPIQEGGVFVGLQDYEELPKPFDLAISFSAGEAMLDWNYAIHKKTYNNYFIERSEDGKSFVRLNELPLTSLNNGHKNDSKRMVYIDSIDNGRTYHYRILGKTPFGELSPVSEVVSGKGIKLLEYVPHITTKDYLDDSRIIIGWEFSEAGNKHIIGFELNRSSNVNEKYDVIAQNIPPQARKIQYDSLQATNYMTVTAIGKNGSRRTSFPALVQPVDSIPPIKPIGFKGEIDTVGIVTLKWNKNEEPDMLGYRIFRGNNKDEEYSQITISPHQGTTYYDSVSVKNLNSKVYYQLVAVDHRFNMSEPSEILEVKKPDFIKPTQPIFADYKVIDGNVFITWIGSSSQDVVKHEIYRKARKGLDWILAHSISKVPLEDNKNGVSIQTSKEYWTDEEVEENTQYSYTIVAIDGSGLESDPAHPLTVVIPKTSLQPPVEGLGSYVDKKKGFIELYWKPYKYENVSEIMIYKSMIDKPATLLRNVAANVKRIVDNQVKPNNEYVYLVRVVFKDGQISETAKLNIKY